jgi:heme-degrading monooxygenase HmoA
MDESFKSVTSVAWPEAKKAKGYKGYLHLRNPETGEAMTVSLWDTEEDMLASEKAYYEQVTKRGNALGVKNLGAKHFVVGIKD